MKTVFTKSLLALLVSAGLFSFTTIGGEGVTIKLNGKTVLEHYFIKNAATPTLSLTTVAANDQLYIEYNECGQIGTDRTLQLKAGNKVLKSWDFADGGREMKVKAKEILENTGKGQAQLVYTSKMVDKGRVLANIVTKEVSASR